MSNHRRLVEPDHRLGEGVIERITLAPDRRRNADGREANQSSLLADPVFHDSRNDCSPSEIRLETGINVLSRWVHWYADWEPTIFPDLESGVNSMTTVLKSSLDKLRASHGVEIARLVRIRWASRREIYSEYEVEAESYWV